jgi:hypothetical protein
MQQSVLAGFERLYFKAISISKLARAQATAKATATAMCGRNRSDKHRTTPMTKPVKILTFIIFNPPFPYTKI